MLGKTINLSIKDVFKFMTIAIVVIFAIGSIFTIFDDEIAKFLFWLFQIDDKKEGIKKEWIGFWGNVFGSLIQGIVTAAGIVVSLLIFQEDKTRNENSKNEERERQENDAFVKSFGTTLNYYDTIIHLVSGYTSLDTYIEGDKMGRLKSLSINLNNSEVILIISLIQQEIADFNYLKQELTDEDAKSRSDEFEQKIKLNMDNLQDILKAEDLSNIKLLEHVKKVLVASGQITLYSSSSMEANAEVIKGSPTNEND
jgi:hypothetical protein